MNLRAPIRAALALFLAFCLTFSPNVFALGPFEKQHPKVSEGMEAYDQGRYEDALRAFDEAKKELPTSAAVEFNRGNALFKLGRLEEAKAAYDAVGKMDQKDLHAADHYNMGNTLAALGDKKEAIKAYRRALKLDPKDEQARHNLEVLLRDLKPPLQQQTDGGTDGGQGDGGQQDGGTPKNDGGTDGGEKPDGGNDGGMQPDGGSDGGTDGGTDAGMDGGSDGGQGDGGESGDAGMDGGQDGGEGQGEGEGDKGDAGVDGGSPSEASSDDGMDAGVELLPDGGIAGMSKEDAEKLLDAMKQNEKNLQLWKFQKQKPRKQNEKDW